MEFVIFLSEAAVPLVIATVIIHGFVNGTDVYNAFIDGAADGVKTVMGILPTLIGLMTAVGVLSGSGALGAVSELISPLTEAVGYPSEAVPLAVMRLVSSSASTGLLLDIFKSAGPDSFIGRYVSIMMSATETVFYTMAVYFMSVKITKTRHTLFCALMCNIVGVVFSFFVTRAIFY